jgi:hypothetical protein
MIRRYWPVQNAQALGLIAVMPRIIDIAPSLGTPVGTEPTAKRICPKAQCGSLRRSIIENAPDSQGANALTIAISFIAACATNTRAAGTFRISFLEDGRSALALGGRIFSIRSSRYDKCYPREPDEKNTQCHQYAASQLG